MKCDSMKCPCPKAFGLCVVAGFIFIFVTDFIIHGQLLAGMYENTSHLWRPEEEMVMPWMFAVQILIVLITASIYGPGHEGKGIGEGVRFGVMLGALFAVMMASSYAWMPIPIQLAIGWGAAGFVQGLGLGVIYSLLYKQKQKTET